MVTVDEEVILANAMFEVPADNYEEFDKEIDPAKLGAKLLQSNTLKGTRREYQFYASDHLLLNLVERERAKEKHFRVNLAWLSSEPEHNKVIVWKWLYWALAAGALAGLSLFLGLSETLTPLYCLVAGTIASTASLICGLIFLYLMRDEFIFKSRYGNTRLFLIDNKKPSQQEFDRFFIGLQQAIEKAQSKSSVSDRLVGELKMCRRLRDEGIIGDEAYTIARTAIFKHKQYKS
jgi:hypothetical protein